MARKIRLEAIGSECNALSIEFDYEEGGHNHWNGSQDKRGLYAYVTPVMIEQKEGYSTVKQQVGKGAKLLLEELSRRNQKKLDALDFKDERVTRLINFVCNKYDIIITDKNWA